MANKPTFESLPPVAQEAHRGLENTLTTLIARNPELAQAVAKEDALASALGNTAVFTNHATAMSTDKHIDVAAQAVTGVAKTTVRQV